MQVILELDNQQQLQELLERVKDLRWASSLRVVKNGAAAAGQALLPAIDWSVFWREQAKKPAPPFGRTREEIDQQLDAMREEWEREALKPTVARFWGIAPSLDYPAFEKYLHQIRQEWNRPIS